MAYTRTWNAAYEAIPAGSDLGSTIDNRIRETKQDIRERIAKDHYMDVAGTDADHGEHVQVTLRTGGYAGSGAADKAVLHAVDDTNSKARPCYTDEDGNEDLRLVALAAATEMAFFQAAAPVGWTQNTTNTDAFLRVVSTAGGGTGGSVSAATLAHTHTGPNHYHSIPNHTHQWYSFTGSTDYTFDGNGAATPITVVIRPAGSYISSELLAGNKGMDRHGFTSSWGSQNTYAAGTGNTGSASITPKYVNMIICSLD